MKMNYSKKVKLLICVLWFFTILFACICIICLPNFFAIFPFLIALLLIPVVGWQRKIKTILRHKWIKPALLALLLAAFLVSYFVSKEDYLSNQKVSPSLEHPTQVEITAEPQKMETPPALESENVLDSDFEIRFLDVGEADATLVCCGGKYMLIDSGNVSDSSFIYSYLKSNKIDYLDYIVCTHPHEDHVGGLAGALNFAQVGRAFCSSLNYDTKAFNSFVKYLEKQNIQLEIPEVGASFMLGTANVSILGPIRRNANLNNESIVLRIEYLDTSFLLMGDAEIEEEDDIINSNAQLESTLLKVGHHGSNTSSSIKFLEEVHPKFAVISVGENGYGHPDAEVIKRLERESALIYRTDLSGNIICKSDGKNISIYQENDSL